MIQRIFLHPQHKIFNKFAPVTYVFTTGECSLIVLDFYPRKEMLPVFYTKDIIVFFTAFIFCIWSVCYPEGILLFLLVEWIYKISEAQFFVCVVNSAFEHYWKEQLKTDVKVSDWFPGWLSPHFYSQFLFNLFRSTFIRGHRVFPRWVETKCNTWFSGMNFCKAD